MTKQLTLQKAECFKHHSTIEPTSGKNLPTSSVRKGLFEAGLYGRITVKKLLLKKENNVKRIRWAKAHKDWTIEKGNKVLWTDK